MVAPVGAFVAGSVGMSQMLVDGKEPWIDIKPKQRLFAGTEVRTFERSVIILALTDGTKLRLQGGARLKLEELSAAKTAVYVPQGKLEAWVRKKAGRAFHARTPVSVVSVHGTVFALNVARDGYSTVDLFSGRLSVIDNFGRQQSVTSGQRLLADVSLGAARPMPLPEGVEASPEPMVAIPQLAGTPAEEQEEQSQGEEPAPEQVAAETGDPSSDPLPTHADSNVLHNIVVASPSSP